MSRLSWAAAWASSFAFALTPGVAAASGNGSRSPDPAGLHVTNDNRPGHSPADIRRKSHAGAQRPDPVLLEAGSGYQQVGGSPRVRTLQRELLRFGFAPGPIDGLYGPLTTAAVERFQSAHDLSVDGIVGSRTQATLSALAHGDMVPGMGYGQVRGSPRVRTLQRRLAHMGFAPGPIDGRYGPLTTEAVVHFQSARRLAVDGIVGPHTGAALDVALHLRATPSRHKGAPRFRPPPAPKPLPLLHVESRQSFRRRTAAPALTITLVLLGLTALGYVTLSLSRRRARARRKT